MKTIATDTRVFYKSVFTLVLPMALQNLINVAVTSADVMMLGKLGDTVLSGASLAGQIQYIMTLIFFGITSGSAVLAAQYWGKRDAEAIEKILGIALRFSLTVSVVFAFVSIAFPYQCMSLFSNEQPVIDEGVKYLKIISFSYIFTSFTMIYLNIMRSLERVIISTVVYMSSLLCNIILNWLLIFGKFGLPQLGIEGAAVATCFARVTEFIIVFFYSRGKKIPVHFKVSNLIKIDKILFSDFLKYSLPVMLNELAWGAGGAMNTLIMGKIGETVVSANAVAQNVRQFSTVIAFGVANATAIMLGKIIGAGELKKAEMYAGRFLRLTLIIGAFAGVIVLIIRPFMIDFVELSPQAEEYLGVMLFVMSYFVFAQTFNTTTIVGILRSGGDTIFGLIMDVSTMWGGSILFGALSAFVFKFDVPVVYIVLMSDEVIKIPLSIYRYRTKKWLKNVTRE